MRARLTARGWALLLATAACAGGAAPQTTRLAPGERVDVEFAADKLHLTIRNVGSLDQAAYKEKGTYGAGSADTKFADDGTMAALLDALTELGQFSHGGPEAKPGTKATLTVRRGDKTSVWSRPALLVEHMPELQRFDAARTAFLHVHDNVVSFHASTMTAEELHKSMQDQEQRNRQAVQNILQKARGQ